MRRPSGTDGSLLPSLPWTLFALGFSVLPHIPFIPVWISAALLICATGRLYIERRRRRLPPASLRVVLALMCFIGVLATYQNITGVGPGSALLVVMAALKLMETRKRRDQFVLLFISIFLIMASLLRDQYIWSLPFLLVGVLITMTAWLRMSAGATIGIRRSFATGSRMLLYAAPITLAMWVFFPRLASPFWSVPIDTSRAQSGLSDTMSPGDISSLSLSNAVAFRVDFAGDVPAPPDLYWRGLVLHRFNGRTWTGNEVSISTGIGSPVEYLGGPVRYQITLEPTSRHWVYALDIPYEWSLDQTIMGRQNQLARRRPIDQRMSFSATSYLDYRLDVNREIRVNDYYRSLPENSNTETQKFAKKMHAEATSDANYINNVLKMFHEQEYYYTLDPPALGSNPVDRFLFRTRQGFCEHYASAFAVLMRAAGIPSRIVLGYQGGELNSLGGYLIVRQSDAHAWNEVWLPNRGWTRVDPTGAVAPERISSGIAGAMFGDIGASWGLSSPSMLLHQLTLTWDAINAKWNEWVLGYGPENQNRLMKWLGMGDPDWQKMILTLLGIVAIIIAAISFLLIYRNRPPPKDEAAVLYQKFASRVGIQPVTGETPYVFASRIRNEDNVSVDDSDRVTELYLDARYGPPNPDALRALRESVRAYSSA